MKGLQGFEYEWAEGWRGENQKGTKYKKENVDDDAHGSCWRMLPSEMICPFRERVGLMGYYSRARSIQNGGKCQGARSLETKVQPVFLHLTEEGGLKIGIEHGRI